MFCVSPVVKQTGKPELFYLEFIRILESYPSWMFMWTALCFFFFNTWPFLADRVKRTWVVFSTHLETKMSKMSCFEFRFPCLGSCVIRTFWSPQYAEKNLMTESENCSQCRDSRAFYFYIISLFLPSNWLIIIMWLGRYKCVLVIESKLLCVSLWPLVSSLSET